MQTRHPATITTDGILTIEGYSSRVLDGPTPDADAPAYMHGAGRFLPAANRAARDLGLQIDYGWLDSLDGGLHGHLISTDATGGTWD